MNARLRRVIVRPAVYAACFGVLFGLSLLVRVAFGLPAFGGPELFLWAVVVVATLTVAVLAEFVPATFRPKRFLLGFAALSSLFGCALAAYWVRTGDVLKLDSVSFWTALLLAVAGGLLVHFGYRNSQPSQPNQSPELTRER